MNESFLLRLLRVQYVTGFALVCMECFQEIATAWTLRHLSPPLVLFMIKVTAGDRSGNITDLNSLTNSLEYGDKV